MPPRFCTVWSGRTRVMKALVSVLPVTRRLTRWPAAPLKTSRMTCPGTVLHACTGGPPGVIAPITSVPVNNWKVAQPLVASAGSMLNV